MKNQKAIYFFCLVVLGSRLLIAQTPNYVRTYTANSSGYPSMSALKAASHQDVLQSTEYLDDLGRKIQEVVRRGSPTERDAVTMYYYDNQGRAFADLLPFTMATYDGSFKTFDTGNPFYEFYNTSDDKVADAQWPLVMRKFDNSPLNRVIEEGGPGKKWLPGEDNVQHSIRYTYQSNRAVDEVLIWQYKGGELLAKSLYAPGELAVKVTRDEHFFRYWEFTDKRGKKVMDYREGEEGERFCTYYLYDFNGNLTYVIPPLTIGNLGLEYPKVIDEETLASECYQYQYDDQGRMVSKQLPGAAPVYMTYDPWSRLVLTQSGTQRVSNKWSFVKYDVFDRAVMIGEVIMTGTQQQVSDQVATFYQYVSTKPNKRYESVGGSLHGYTNRSFPVLSSSDEVNEVTYYDHYAFLTTEAEGEDFSFVAESGHTDYLSSISGQIAGQKIRVLGSDDYLLSVSYYDRHYRPIQVISTNHLGGVDRLTNTCDFKGALTSSLQTHTVNTTTVTVLQEMEYDHGGRLVRVHHQVNDQEKIILSEQEYNELNQLVDKKLHSVDEGLTFMQSVDYRYHIKGWLTSVNHADLATDPATNEDADARSDLFGMSLHYDDVVADLANVPQYNGNVSAVQWKNAHFGEKQSYRYSYDAFDRLKGAGYKNFTSPAKDGTYDVGGADGEQIGYDANGNITSISRRGWVGGANTLIDELSYGYEGDQLTSVSDYSGRSEGFQATTSGVAYVYDANGNMIEDAHKGIEVSYNHLNLPRHIEKSTGEYLIYGYDANGTKLYQEVYAASGDLMKRTDYAGPFIYENNELQFIQHAEGRVLPNSPLEGGLQGGVFTYQYDLKDHLGNTRASFKVEESELLYLVTSEKSRHAEEESFFNFAGTKYTYSNANHTLGGSRSMRLTGGQPSMSLSVDIGDRLQLETYGYYEQGIINPDPGDEALMISQGVSGLVKAAGIASGEAVAQSTLAATPSALSLLAVSGGNNGAPEAHLNYLLLDQSLTTQKSGFKAISQMANFTHEHLAINDIVAEAPGYAYIYLSDGKSNQIPVYFDDLQVKLTTTNPVLTQVDDYYPFGMVLGANHYTGPEELENSYQYNGKETQDELDLGWIDYGARMYDPALGRWNSIDPKAQAYVKFSPYHYALNNPLKYVDPNGKDSKYAITNDENGNRVMTIQSKIYISSGEDLDKGELSAKYQKGLEQITGKEYKVKANDGNEYIVKFDVEFSADPLNLDEGNNAIKILSGTSGRSKVRGTATKGKDGNYSGTSGRVALIFGEDYKELNKVIHEVLGHMVLGLTDRYVDAEDGKSSISDKGFDDDLMGGKAKLGLNPVHLENYVNKALSTGQTSGAIKTWVDVDEKGKLIGGSSGGRQVIGE